jgi:hypothetical protein
VHDACSLRESTADRDSAQPVRLGEDRATRLSRHTYVYTIAAVTDAFPYVQREHEIQAGERVVAEGKSVLVGYDYEAAASVPLTENQRRRLAE